MGEVPSTARNHHQPVQRKLEQANSGYRVLRHLSVDARASWMNRVADLLEQDAATLGKLIMHEMGKTIGSAVAEVRKSAIACRYYADNAADMLADEPIATEAERCFLRFEPIGTIFGIMPWNYPFWQTFRFAAPALMAGNSVLMKPAPIVPMCGEALEDIFIRAGWPTGSFQSIMLDTSQVEDVIADRRVAAVTLTGSEAAGISVAEIAGRHLKKVVLELGGSDPLIIMESADIEKALRAAVESRMINAGQSCIAAKRILIAETIYDACERELVQRVSALRIGDPSITETEVGPLAETRLVERLDAQVRRAQAEGARLLTGGSVSPLGPRFYEPTILADIPEGAATLCEEFFGPVMMLFRVRDAQHAVEVANATPFGLSASVWSRDPAEQEFFVRELESGQVFLNAMTVSDPRVPFGGVKRSGIGRELGSFGLREFVNVKAVSYFV